MRFDDSLATVLAADASTSFGARAAFLQLSDLLARRRVPANDELIARMRELRPLVKEETRAAAARGLALADPPLALVALFGDDTPPVAATVLRVARLAPEGWDGLIERVGPFGRSVLRSRTDLPPSAVRTLERFARVDMALSDGRPEAERAVVRPATDAKSPDVAEAAPRVGETPRRQAPAGFEIADLVSRIERHRRDPAGAASAVPARVDAFRFETDATGTVRWVDTAPREPLIGLTLRHDIAAPVVDGVAGGGLRHRAPFADAHMAVPGTSAVGGDWRISAVPLFERQGGRFIGMRGRARRPAVEDTPTLAPPLAEPTGEGLRRLMHELRTPTNAIAGFSELIEQQLLGEVAPSYRSRASAIRGDVGDLIGAIDDIDLSARLDARAQTLRREVVDLDAALAQVTEDLRPLAERRAATLAIRAEPGSAVAGDRLLTERLVQRLGIVLLAAAAPGETVTVTVTQQGSSTAIAARLPTALRGRSERELLSLDPAGENGAPLLGTGFTLRLMRRLAVQMGGTMGLDGERLTLALPAAFIETMEPASTLRP